MDLQLFVQELRGKVSAIRPNNRVKLLVKREIFKMMAFTVPQSKLFFYVGTENFKSVQFHLSPSCRLYEPEAGGIAHSWFFSKVGCHRIIWLLGNCAQLA